MKSADNLYVDVHVLQTVPPSCVNRDDTGSPKTAVYGGVTRARVSSQSWKRAIRLYFRQLYRPEDLGLRTKRIVAMVENELAALSPEAGERKRKLAADVLTAAGLKLKEKDLDKGTDALFFMSVAQAKALAALALQPDAVKDKALCKAALSQTPSVDMALFGRMVADDPSLNYDAAAQVAHAISTHAVQNEFDYFTAVDDCAPEDNAGAGHLGTVEFNSSTLYRYACVNVNELKEHLGDAAALAVRRFVEAMVLSMPTGKQNTFANRTLPDAVYVTLRRDQPVNLAGAFERPVSAGESGGFLEGSQQRLAQYAGQVYATFAEPPFLSFVTGEGLSALGPSMRLDALLEALEAAVSQGVQ